MAVADQMTEMVGGSISPGTIVLCFIVSYLIGSIPFGLILTRIFGAGDLRSIGSGNIGATNVLRTGRKGLALGTLLLDALKGAIPVFVAGRYAPELAAVAGLGAVIGHCFPVWLRFNGGKGVATAAGVALTLTPLVALCILAIFIVIVAITRYVSLSSILASVAAVPLAYLFGQTHAALFYIALAIIILAKHQANIGRLLAGNESKVSFGKSSSPDKT